QVNLDWQRGLADPAEGFAVTSDGFIALLADGVRHRARRYVRAGNAWKAEDIAAKNVQAVRVSQDGKTLVYLHSTAAEPPRWYRARLDAGINVSVAVTDLQADLRKKPIAKTETFRWKGALGEEVEGLVSYP